VKVSAGRKTVAPEICRRGNGRLQARPPQDRQAGSGIAPIEREATQGGQLATDELFGKIERVR
jgi:hypothetical protein